MPDKESGAGGFGLAVGDDDAFARFYDATSTAAFSVALRITGSRSAAEDVCETAYVKVWQARALPGAAGEPTGADLLAVVRDLAFEHRPSGEPADASPTASTAVEAALDSAGPLGRRAVELAYFGGLSVPEISSILGVTASETRTAMRAALLAAATATREAQP